MTAKRGHNRRATSWAWSRPLPAPSKFVLLALATLATGPDHRVKLEATATVRDLSDLTAYGRRTVRTHLRQLEDAGLLIAEERVDENGARLANRWHLNVDGLAPVALAVPTPWDGRPRAQPPPAPPPPPADPDDPLPLDDWNAS